MTHTKKLLFTTYTIYFICGLAQAFEGVFLPEFKTHFDLSYTQQMYLTFAKNIPFVIFSIAIGYAIKRIGYKSSLSISLVLFTIGTLLLVPALKINSFPLMLIAFFIIGVGFNIELVAGNPMLAALGIKSESATRLNVGNALGAFAQIIAPFSISIVVPVTVITAAETIPYMIITFTSIGAIIGALALFTFFLPEVNPHTISESNTTDTSDDKSIWRQKEVWFGFLAIFFVMGIESGIFGFFRNYLEDKEVAGLNAHQSQQLFTVYFLLFALGRLSGAFLQKKFNASHVMLFFLAISMVLLTITIFATNTLAIVAITLLGFFVSLFFPTLYAIAIQGLGLRTSEASGLLTMGFLGGAVLPLLQGKIADNVSISYSFAIGIIPYCYVALYILIKSKVISNRK